MTKHSPSALTETQDILSKIKAGASSFTMEHFTVVKRDGTIVPFHRSRIERALDLAFHDTKKVPFDKELSPEWKDVITFITDRIIEQLYTLASKGSSLSVEGIQDLVEVTLMKMDYHDVARDYIIYRDKHKLLRDDSPRHLKIYRKDGSMVRFNPMKIAASLESAFRHASHIQDQTPPSVIEQVNSLTDTIVNQILKAHKEEVQLTLALIQDTIEEHLMQLNHFKAAKAYILMQANQGHPVTLPQDDLLGSKREFKVTMMDGNTRILQESHLIHRLQMACKGLKEVNEKELLEMVVINFYEGIKEHEVEQALIMAARSQIEIEPAYATVAARLLCDTLYQETMQISAAQLNIKEAHEAYFKNYIKMGISLERLSPQLLEFDLERLARTLDLQRDDLFSYLGLQTLYDRYFIHEQERRLETPQIFWMRVAMGLSLGEGALKNEKAIEFYNLLSQFNYTSATPTLFNSGTTHSQLSSCYLSTVMDDLSHIFKVVSDDAQLSKWAGGIGNDWSNVRATGSLIKGTNGKSQGIIPFLKVANDTAVAVNQGGKRKGAMCAYLETWHLDIEDFLELRKNTGDDRRRTHDMNTANWIPDLFMKRVAANESWTLFSPNDVPDLHHIYGKEFEARYTEYEAKAFKGEITLFKKVAALDLWRKMLSMLFETGHPWITFKDPSNIRSPQSHMGVVHSSNLCTEILLNTSAQETAVCNLGSINLANHCTKEGLDEKKLQQTIKTAIRMLDNVIDINFYPITEAASSNVKHRPIGLGLMGFQDALYIQNISYASHEAVEFADQAMEMISYYAILASSELAKERGAYPSYKGSKWDQGLLPIDTLGLLAEERGSHFDVNKSSRMDWSVVRESVKKYGMRNCNTMAIAPTATISNITNVTQSIEPTYKHLFVKSNLSGEFTVPNIYLVKKLKELGLWDQEMLDDLKYFDGSITEIDRIPEEVKRIFFTAFEIDPEWIIECASRRQKWIDMGQSLNLYIESPSGKKLHDMYFLAWTRGLKTTYYLRAMAATQIEKSTTDINKRGLQPRWMKNKSASSNIKVNREEEAPKACRIGDESCESCQ
ncbi:MAG: ribonucleoside-diphosphate reductase subunit alpha [Candidatus Rhabdochlamydia sp.]